MLCGQSRGSLRLILRNIFKSRDFYKNVVSGIVFQQYFISYLVMSRRGFNILSKILLSVTEIFVSLLEVVLIP